MTGTGHLGAIVITSSTPLWYATRATGLVALVLLTASMALGLLSSVRFQRPAWPRFVTLGLHRNLALLALGFTGVHVLTTVLDSFVSIPLQDAFIPFISSYRPIWVGLGAIALDLMLALIITSLLRTRMTLRSWRVVHWTAYLCWPVAVLHGLGTGHDTPVRWVLVLTACCVLAVVLLTFWRLALAWPGRPVASTAGVLLMVVMLIAGGAWLRAGPLSPGWGARSGTRTTPPAGAARPDHGASR
jgi:predicted ferric reductase